jgi:hypothetical protein
MQYPSRCFWLPNGRSFFLGTLVKNCEIFEFVVPEEVRKGVKLEERVWVNLPDHLDDLAVSTNGQHIVVKCHSKSKERLCVFNTETRVFNYSIDTPKSTKVVISSDSQRILLRLVDGGHWLINIPDGTVIRKFPAATLNTASSLPSAFGGLHESWILRVESGKCPARNPDMYLGC